MKIFNTNINCEYLLDAQGVKIQHPADLSYKNHLNMQKAQDLAILKHLSKYLLGSLTKDFNILYDKQFF